MGVGVRNYVAGLVCVFFGDWDIIGQKFENGKGNNVI